MAEAVYDAVSRHNFHLRSCSQIVTETMKLSLGYSSARFRISKGNEEIDATSILSLLTLGINEKDKVRIKVSGPYPQKMMDECAEKIGKCLESITDSRGN